MKPAVKYTRFECPQCGASQRWDFRKCDPENSKGFVRDVICVPCSDYKNWKLVKMKRFDP